MDDYVKIIVGGKTVVCVKESLQSLELKDEAAEGGARKFGVEERQLEPGGLGTQKAAAPVRVGHVSGPVGPHEVVRRPAQSAHRKRYWWW